MKLTDWMSEIDDNAEVLRLNLAGTHDCVTQYVQFPHISRCQNRNIYEQLCLGVRALDIRVESDGRDRLKMVHGPAKAFNTANRFFEQMDMADVLAHCFKFLEEHNGETIVFQFKNDSGLENEKCFDNMYNTYIKANKDKWFLENRSPRLFEARGKIIFIRRCKKSDNPEYTNENSGIDFSDWVEQEEKIPTALPLETGGKSNMHFLIQDRYEYTPKPRWNDVIKPFLDSMEKFNGTYIINYLSTAGGVMGPYNNSKYINPQFSAYPLDKSKYYGTIYIDFPTEDIVKKIAELNF